MPDWIKRTVKTGRSSRQPLVSDLWEQLNYIVCGSGSSRSVVAA